MSNHNQLPNKPNQDDSWEDDENIEEIDWAELARDAEEFSQKLVAEAPGRAKGFCQEIAQFEKSFIDRVDELDSNSGRIEEKELVKWEDMISDELKLVKREEERANFDLETLADVMQNMVINGNKVTLGRTIEAQAGHFHRKRMGALKEAIEAVGGEGAEEDLEFVKGFYPKVAEHLDFKYMSPDEVQAYGFQEYDERRTRSHNDVIKYLNGLNDLARKYQVRPLTMRNFWPSDLRGKDSQTPAMAQVMSYDRSLVERYYENAFADDVKQRSAKLRRNMPFLY